MKRWFGRIAGVGRHESVLVALVATALILISSGLHMTPYNNYILLAQAFLNGHVWIDWPGEAIDALAFQGKYYVIEAPLPAIILLPAVAWIGNQASQTILSGILGGIAVGAAWQVALRLGLSQNARVILVAFFFVGTDLWWCSMYGDVWFLAHASAVCFTMLALAELLGKRRGWLVGLFGACAAASRFDLVLALPVYAYLFTRDRDPAEIRRSLVAFCAVIAPFVIGWVVYNELRWGLPYDVGYTLWYHADQIGDLDGPPFKLKYVPFELYSFFVAPPHLATYWPYIGAPNAGIALTWTSPALLLALLARRPRYLVTAMWLLVAAIWIPLIFYYANGASQFGMRHSLDFEPFLFVLIALGIRERIPIWGMILFAYSIAFGFWGLWYWRAFFRANY